MSNLIALTETLPEGRYDYSVDVRGTVYLWGSAGVAHDVNFPTPLLLHISNDLFGEPVTLGTETAAGAKTAIGSLEPGEHLTLPIQGLSGVTATSAPHSTVACSIRSAS